MTRTVRDQPCRDNKDFKMTHYPGMRYSLWDMNLALPRVSAHAAAVVLLAALVALIATAAVYEVMFDIRVIGFPAGADTGASPRFQTTLLEAAFLAMTSA